MSDCSVPEPCLCHSAPLRVVVVEDQAFVRRSLRLCVAAMGHEVVAEAADGPSALDAIVANRPDLILLDFGLPGPGGIETLLRAKSRIHLDSRVLVLSAYCARRTVEWISKAEVHGFIDIGSQMHEDICDAITTISSGGTYFSRSFQRIRSEMRADPLSFEKLLTKQEYEIVRMVGELLPDSEIKSRLKVKNRTLRWHLQNVMWKLDIHSRQDLLRWAGDNGFLLEFGRSRQKRIPSANCEAASHGFGIEDDRQDPGAFCELPTAPDSVGIGARAGIKKSA